MNKTIYIVKYSKSQYEGYEEIDIFVTESKNKAIKYRAKFNRILKKWQKHYYQYEDDAFPFRWIKDEHIEQHYHRWRSLIDTNGCYIKEIEQR